MDPVITLIGNKQDLGGGEVHNVALRNLCITAGLDWKNTSKILFPKTRTGKPGLLTLTSMVLRKICSYLEEKPKKGQRQVSYAQGKEFADQQGFQFFETSAKTGYNVEKAFIETARERMRQMQNEPEPIRKNISNPRY